MRRAEMRALFARMGAEGRFLRWQKERRHNREGGWSVCARVGVRVTSAFVETVRSYVPNDDVADLLSTTPFFPPMLTCNLRFRNPTFCEILQEFARIRKNSQKVASVVATIEAMICVETNEGME